jgi:hypothetical protein
MQNQLATNISQAQNVFITVAGGVAYVAQSPESVKVYIIDCDDLRADFDLTFGRLAPEAQAFFLKLENRLASSPNG